MQHSRQARGLQLTVCGRTDVGRRRERNEDAFVISDLTTRDISRDASLLPTQGPVRFEIGERGVLLAVSDGLGGHPAGDIASALVVEALSRSMARQPVPEACCELLDSAVKRANHEVWEASHSPWRRGMGATLTAIFFHHKTAHIAEVGDSRAYLLRGGQIQQITHDQSYTQLLVDNGELRPSQARTSPRRNFVLQAMGLGTDIRAELGCLALRDKDYFLLCSDGLSNAVRDSELRAILLEAPTLDVACDRLVALANARGGDDNITAVVAGVSGDLPAFVFGERLSETHVVVQEFEPPLLPRLD
jgi:serine/threonine protein phosphatase PrpC